MILNEIWFSLFLVVIAGYLILDGFDMGVGILHPFLAKTDQERRISLNSIGPVWDGNEVWIVLGGGALFAAFPMVYASLFAGFYAAMMLVLLVMILRTCAIEFRSKREGAAWRTLWDMTFFASSLGLALLLGVAFGNILSGMPIDPNGDMHITLLELLNPYALLIGVTTVVMLATHGAMYLEMRTEGDLHKRVKGVIPVLTTATAALVVLVIVVTLGFRSHLAANYQSYIWPVIFPAGALAALAVAWRMSRAGQYLKAFVASSAMIALLLVTAAAGMFPNMLIIYNAASESNTLTVMLVITLIGMPLVLLYHAAVYYIFRGKIKLDSRSY
jgi:cytochrome d ubiquinol oxidase subunit II